MVRLQTKNMTDTEVRDVAQPILAKRFAKYGFDDLAVHDEQDFDGEHILRMIASVRRQVPAHVLIDTLDAIRSELLGEGEERFVFLSARSDEDDVVDEEEFE